MRSPARFIAAILASSLPALAVASAEEGIARREVAQATGAPTPVSQPHSFSAFSARGGQPVARPPAPETIIEETSTEPAGSPVPPGVHLSPLTPIIGKEELPPDKPGGKRRREAEAARQADRKGVSRRGGAQCTEILQRATVGELSREDVEILRTQCR